MTTPPPAGEVHPFLSPEWIEVAAALFPAGATDPSSTRRIGCRLTDRDLRMTFAIDDVGSLSIAVDDGARCALWFATTETCLFHLVFGEWTLPIELFQTGGLQVDGDVRLVFRFEAPHRHEPTRARLAQLAARTVGGRLWSEVAKIELPAFAPADLAERLTDRGWPHLGEALVLAGSTRPGFQFAVEVDGERVLDVAEGVASHDRPTTPSEAFVLYSAGKPFLATALLVAEDRGALSLDAALSSYGPPFDRVPTHVSARSLLTHQVGLPSDPISDSILRPPDEQLAMALGGLEASRPATSSRYMPFLSWVVLGALAEVSTGREAHALIGDLVLAPLQLQHTYAGATESSAPMFDVNGDEATENALFRYGDQAKITNLGVVMRSSAGDLCRLDGAYARPDRGADLLGLSSPELLRGARTLHASNRRGEAWGQGFQVQAGPDAPFVGLGPATFGHEGQTCHFHAADPRTGVALAFTSNGLVTEQRHLASMSAVGRAVAADLHQLTDPGPDA